jgi:PAS domain S-box-containing protein
MMENRTSVSNNISLFYDNKPADIHFSQLLDNETVFQQLADYFPQLMWIANPDGWIYWYNRQWYHYTGTTPEQMRGWGWQSVHDPDVLQDVMTRWQSAITTEQPFEMTFPLRGADGVFRCFLTRIVPIKDNDGRVIRWFGTNTDVSEQVEMKQLLNEEAKKKQALIEFQQLIASSKESTLYEHIVNGCLRVVNTADAAVVELLDGDVLVYKAASGRLAQFTSLTLKHNGSLSGSAIKTNTPLISEDTELDSRVDLASCRKVGIRSMVVLPIMRLGEAVGVLKLASSQPNSFSNNDVALGQLMVSVISSAFSNMAEAEALLKAKNSDDRFKQVLNVLPGMFWITGAAGQCEFVSEQWMAYTGQHFNDSMGMGWLDVIHQEDQPRTIACWMEAVQAQRLYEIEYRFRMKDGQYRWFFSRAYPIFDEHKHVTHWYGSCTDIHDRKLAENALKESEWRFRFIADAAPLMIWMVDTTGNLTYCNKTMHDFVGPSIDIANTWKKAIHPEDKPWVTEQLSKCLKQRIAFEVEFRVRHSSGDYFWLLLVGVPRYNEYGDFLGLVGSGINVNDRKIAEKALEKAKTEFQEMAFEREAILGQLSEGVIITDQQGKIIFVNDAAASLHGYAKLGVSPERYAETYNLLTLDGLPHPVEQLPLYRAIYNHETVLNARWRIKRPSDGSEIIALGNAKPVHRPDGSLIGAVLVIQDDTERQAYEQALRASELALQQLNEALEQRVVERTAQLQAINKELEAFSYSVSHDLRAPLRSINGFSQALMDEYKAQLDETAQDYLARVCNNTLKMSKLIDAMLQLSRITRVEIKKECVDLSDMVQSILQDLRQQEPERVVDIRVQSDVNATADIRLLHAVLENLIGNSWKYTAFTENPVIQFGAIHQGEQSYYYVKDNGAGFDMRYANKLFGAFQRLHGVQEFPGTGVGLASAARIIRRHGGQIWADATVNAGATFYFSLYILKNKPDSLVQYLSYIEN